MRAVQFLLFQFLSGRPDFSSLAMADYLPSTSSSGYDDAEESSYLVTVPDVVLTHVLSYLSYEQISQIRMLCSRFNFVGQQILNQGFSKLDRYHSQCAKELKAQLPRRESERRLHPLAKHFDILSAVETRLSLLAMTYSKYIDLQLCCFIPGKVIDEAFRVLHIVKTTQDPPRTHELLQELRDLSSMAMEHFDEKIVPDLKKRSGVEVRLSNLANHALSTLSGRSLKVNSSLSVPSSGSREQYSKLHSQYKATLASFNTHRRELATCKMELAEMRRAADEQGRKMTQLQQLTAELSSRLAAQNTRVTDQEKRLVEQDKRMAEMEQRLEAVAAGRVIASPSGVPLSTNTSNSGTGVATTSKAGTSVATTGNSSLPATSSASGPTSTSNSTNITLPSSETTSHTTISTDTTNIATSEAENVSSVSTSTAEITANITTSTTENAVSVTFLPMPSTSNPTTLPVATMSNPTTSGVASNRDTTASPLSTVGDNAASSKLVTGNAASIHVTTASASATRMALPSSTTKRRAEDEWSSEVDASGDVPLRKKEKV